MELCLHSLPGRVPGDEASTPVLSPAPSPPQGSASEEPCSRGGLSQEHSRAPGRTLSFHCRDRTQNCRRGSNLPAPCFASFVILSLEPRVVTVSQAPSLHPHRQSAEGPRGPEFPKDAEWRPHVECGVCPARELSGSLPRLSPKIKKEDPFFLHHDHGNAALLP